jgi:2-haloacid dehalogenase
MQIMKPDPAIYAAVEASCGLAPKIFLFAEDLLQNIAVVQRHAAGRHIFFRAKRVG